MMLAMATGRSLHIRDGENGELRLMGPTPVLFRNLDGQRFGGDLSIRVLDILSNEDRELCEKVLVPFGQGGKQLKEIGFAEFKKRFLSEL